METTDMNRTAAKSCAVGRVWSAIILLFIGLVAGVFGSKYYWQKSATAAMRNGGGTPETGAAISQAANAMKTSTASPAVEWDPIQQMAEIQSQIDQVFQRSFAQFHGSALPAKMETKPGYSLSMDVRDLKDKYQVCAYLPDTKPSDVKVNLTGDQLRVDMARKVTEKPTVKNGETAMTEWGNYEETVHLAGPLKDKQMTVERLPHELIISVPKA